MRPLPRFGPYQALRELARGGMGIVYEAAHEVTGARHAVKTVMRGAEAEELTRFRREAEVLGRLDHPHIVRVHAAELATPTPWMAQDLLPGGTLAERLTRGPLTIDDALALARKLALALAHAHERGVLHRDLKPSNVVFDDRGEPRLVDFGLGRAVDFARLTATGVVLGTPGFMAPELALGERGDDVRTDVYGLGALLYAALTGRPPFEGANAVMLFKEVTEKDAPPLRRARADAPAWLEAVVARALARRPEDRFASAGALASAMDAGAAGPAGSAGSGPRLAPMLAAALSFVVVVALGVFSLPTDEVAEPGASPPSAVVTPTADVVASVASRTASREEVTELLEVIRRTADRDEVRRRLETVGELDPEQRRELAVTCVTTARQSADVAGQVMMRAFAGRPDGLKDLVRYVSLASLAAEVDPSFVLIESEYGEFMQGFWMLAVQKAPSQSAELMTALSLAVPDDPVLLALAAWSRSDASTGSVMVAQLERLRLGEPLQHEGEPSNCAWFRGEILQLLRGRVDRARFQQEVERELERPDASDAARELRGVIDRR